jgi:hypothetical protein
MPDYEDVQEQDWEDLKQEEQDLVDGAHSVEGEDNGKIIKTTRPVIIESCVGFPGEAGKTTETGERKI